MWQRLRQARKNTSRFGPAGPLRQDLIMKRFLDMTYKMVRRIVIGVVGATVLLLGVIMIVTPGPAIVLIPAGLAILGLEFAWARYWLRRARYTIRSQSPNNRRRRALKRERDSGRDAETRSGKDGSRDS
jgi:tellurite resistance protein TerC